MLFQKILSFHGVLATSILFYISNSFAEERFDNKINAPLSIIEANESSADILDLLSIVFPEWENKNIEYQQDVEPIHSKNSSAPLVKVVNEPENSLDLEKIEPNLDSLANEIIFGTVNNLEEFQAEIAQNQEMNTVLEEQDATSRSVEIPSGIENIGADMIKLVNQIIFGEKDPTQRLGLEPVLADIAEAIESSPAIKKSNVNLAIGQANLQALEQSQGFSVSASGGLNYSYTQNSNGSNNRGASVNPTITANKTLYDFGQLDTEINAEIIRQQIKNLENEKVRDELFLKAISSFYEVQRALLQTRLARENLASRKAFVSFIRQRMEIGASSTADVIRAEARVAGALGALSSALESLSIARTNYKSIFGKEAEPYILPRELDLQDLDVESLQNYVQENPDLALVKMNIQIAELDLEKLLIQRKGSINSSLSVRRSYSDSSGVTSDTISGGLSYSVNLFDSGISSTRIDQAKLNLKTLQFEEQRTNIALTQQIEDAFSQYDGKVAAVSSKMLVLEGSKDSYNITKELYTFSRISLFEVLSAQEELFNSGKNLIDSIIDRALAKYKLLYLCDQFQEVQNFGS
ncbi:TolC family protein [Alphaproteobacteria bacterium]|jgi:outer membrane protein TolC|nr:TolC family protein [Alphaproteobacteria bacterium]MDC0462139.1 TolC family protein [Alphaproteobacteria bacterium]